jgi:hypothetical protein
MSGRQLLQHRLVCRGVGGDLQFGGGICGEQHRIDRRL